MSIDGLGKFGELRADLTALNASLASLSIAASPPQSETLLPLRVRIYEIDQQFRKLVLVHDRSNERAYQSILRQKNSCRVLFAQAVEHYLCAQSRLSAKPKSPVLSSEDILNLSITQAEDGSSCLFARCYNDALFIMQNKADDEARKRDSLREVVNRLPKGLQNELFGKVYHLHPGRQMREGWGMRHAFDDLRILLASIQACCPKDKGDPLFPFITRLEIVLGKLDLLPDEREQAVKNILAEAKRALPSSTWDDLKGKFYHFYPDKEKTKWGMGGEESRFHKYPYYLLLTFYAMNCPFSRPEYWDNLRAMAKAPAFSIEKLQRSVAKLPQPLAQQLLEVFATRKKEQGEDLSGFCGRSYFEQMWSMAPFFSALCKEEGFSPGLEAQNEIALRHEILADFENAKLSLGRAVTIDEQVWNAFVQSIIHYPKRIGEQQIQQFRVLLKSFAEARGGAIEPAATKIMLEILINPSEESRQTLASALVLRAGISPASVNGRHLLASPHIAALVSGTHTSLAQTYDSLRVQAKLLIEFERAVGTAATRYPEILEKIGEDSEFGSALRHFRASIIMRPVEFSDHQIENLQHAYKAIKALASMPRGKSFDEISPALMIILNLSSNRMVIPQEISNYLELQEAEKRALLDYLGGARQPDLFKAPCKVLTTFRDSQGLTQTKFKGFTANSYTLGHSSREVLSYSYDQMLGMGFTAPTTHFSYTLPVAISKVINAYRNNPSLGRELFQKLHSAIQYGVFAQVYALDCESRPRRFNQDRHEAGYGRRVFSDSSPLLSSSSDEKIAALEGFLKRGLPNFLTEIVRLLESQDVNHQHQARLLFSTLPQEVKNAVFGAVYSLRPKQEESVGMDYGSATFYNPEHRVQAVAAIRQYLKENTMPHDMCPSAYPRFSGTLQLWRQNCKQAHVYLNTEGIDPARQIASKPVQYIHLHALSSLIKANGDLHTGNLLFEIAEDRQTIQRVVDCDEERILPEQNHFNQVVLGEFGFPQSEQPLDPMMLHLIAHPQFPHLFKAYEIHRGLAVRSISPGAKIALHNRVERLQQVARKALARGSSLSPRDLFFTVFGGRELYLAKTLQSRITPLEVFEFGLEDDKEPHFSGIRHRIRIGVKKERSIPTFATYRTSAQRLSQIQVRKH